MKTILGMVNIVRSQVFNVDKSYLSSVACDNSRVVFGRIQFAG